MTAEQLEEAKKPESVERLLELVADRLSTDAERTAFNCLIDYADSPEWFSSHEGGRLLLLCLEVLHPLSLYQVTGGGGGRPDVP